MHIYVGCKPNKHLNNFERMFFMSECFLCLSHGWDKSAACCTNAFGGMAEESLLS